MLTRRHLIASSAASLALAATARAETVPYVVPDEFLPQYVKVKKTFDPGQILIVTSQHFLYLITEPGQAIRYGIGVGRQGLSFSGKATIDVKKEWPTWRPTDEMIERSPSLYGKYKDNEDAMPGGPGNPLGARALYLFQNGKDTYYRIHGTTEPQSIGQSVSNGCIRMVNEHVVDLYQRVPVGTVVTVY